MRTGATRQRRRGNFSDSLKVDAAGGKILKYGGKIVGKCGQEAFDRIFASRPELKKQLGDRACGMIKAFDDALGGNVGRSQMASGPKAAQGKSSVSSSSKSSSSSSSKDLNTTGSKKIDHPVINGERFGSANKADPHHAFPNVVDNFSRDAQKFSIPTKGEGGKIVRHSDLYQVEGSLNDKSGVFEWIVDNGNISHRRFIPGGKVTGFPNQIPKK